MTNNRGANKLKGILTIVALIAFVIIILNVNKSKDSYQVSYVNPNFIGEGERDITISMDVLSISTDSEEAAVVQYVVKEGDTLNSIATTFWITVSNLKKINKIKSVKPWDKIIVTNEEDGIVYKLRETQNIKVFADKYNLNLEDLMTLNYISDSTEMLYKDQEIFINVSEESANKIPWFIDKGQPDLSPVVVTPKKTTTTKSTTTKTTTTKKTTTPEKVNGNIDLSNGEGAWSSAGKVLSKWTYTENVTNGFYRGNCTWYVATQMPSIFPYVSETKQSRPFGWDAKDWYPNAQRAWFKVWKTPKTWAILVYGQLRHPAGHVAIVRAYYPEKWEMLVEDMNYAGKFIVTQRIESVNRKQIIWYIYPPE